MRKNIIIFKSSLFILLLSFVSFTSILHAQSENATDAVPRFQWSVSEAPGKINIKVNIPKNYYLYRDYTNVKLENADGKTITTEIKPKAIVHTDDFGTKQYIYPAGNWEWEYALPEASTYSVNVKYQGCSEKPFACYPPTTFTKQINVTEDVKTIPIQKKFSSTKKAEVSSIKRNKPEINSSTEVDSYLNNFVQKGGWWILLVALFGGLFSVFTPCVLPLLPITIAVLGAGENATKKQAVRRSFLYVLGIVFTFTSLAVFATLTGKAFGSAALSNPLILALFALFFIVMSFSLLGLYDFQLPSSWSVKLNSTGGNSNFGALLMGLVAGFIAIPCTGPVLATLLGVAAASANVFFGIILLAVYAIGFGIPFFIVGIGLVKAPKSGEYMNLIKSLLGIIILVLSLYILTIVIPSFNTLLSNASFSLKITALALIILGVLFGAFHGDGHSLNKKIKYLKVIGAVFVAFGIIWIVKQPIGQQPELLHWNTNLSEVFTVSKKTDKPILMDFTAEWCTACKELETVTFSDKAVVDELKNNWNLAQVDATRNSAALDKILKKYKIKGFPTIIIFSNKGKELYRFSGFVNPDRLMEVLKEVRGKR